MFTFMHVNCYVVHDLPSSEILGNARALNFRHAQFVKVLINSSGLVLQVYVLITCLFL